VKPISTTNADIPRRPAAGSVFANTTAHSAWPAFVMKVFEPLRTYSPPCRAAVDRSAATSEPAPGSERANEQRIGCSASGGSQRAFCSGEPKRMTGPAPRPFARIDVPIPEQPQFSSSPTSMPSKADRPRPPYSAGTWRFIRPRSCAWATSAAGCRISASCSASLGLISRSAKVRASRRSSFCTSVRAKETPVAVLSSIATIKPSSLLD